MSLTLRPSPASSCLASTPQVSYWRPVVRLDWKAFGHCDPSRPSPAPSCSGKSPQTRCWCPDPPVLLRCNRHRGALLGSSTYFH
eukprot:scaffold106544_cov19-Tisochrysis_lutea.AAC.1